MMTKFLFTRRAALTLALAFGAAPSFAHDAASHGAQSAVNAVNAYAFASLPAALSGSAYVTIKNTGESDDRLLSVRSDVAQKTEIHTHLEEAGVMKMIHLAEGVALPAGETLEFKGGGHHVMFMGLTAPFVAAESFPLTLVFEKAGEQVVEVAIIERGAEAPTSGCDGSAHDAPIEAPAHHH